MSIIPSPYRCTKEDEDEGFLLSGPVTVSYSGQGASGVAEYLCAYLSDRLGLDSLAESQVDAANSEVAEWSRLIPNLPSKPYSSRTFSICSIKRSADPHGHSKSRRSCAGSGSIWLSVLETDALDHLPIPREAYRLCITESQVVIEAQAAHGLFNGMQTLLQLLPAEPVGEVRLGSFQIIDSPRFPWRGVLLDVGRHYFSVPFIKKVLDLMAFYKMNRFHWHLTEDQGWRLEVKQFPKLTEFGAWRGPNGRQYGGFYTQDQVREVIAFAAERFIEVIPEIELPGHCCAALACYPNLSCTGKMTEVPDFWGVQEEVYCAGKEETFQFLEAVLGEVIELFPSDYIHIGGDECPKVRWSNCKLCQKRIREENLPDEYSLQSWFIGRINTFLMKCGKRAIGWDEILEGGLNPGTLVMSWRGITGGVRAAKEGHQVIMTPTSHCYFDYRQSLRSDEPGAWFAMLPLEMVYDYDPIPPQPDFERVGSPAEDSNTLEPRLETPHGSLSRAQLDTMSEGPSEDQQNLAMAMSEDAEVLPGQDMPVEGREEVSMSRGTSSKDAAPDQLDVVFSASLPTAYQGRPEDDWTLESRHAPLIIGGQANLWTEYIRDEETVEYMLLPRLCAMSEALWSPPHDRNWMGFLSRLKGQLPHLDARGFRYRPLA